ncbi:FAD-dependent monooxygenase [Streptomyces boetiae]|uniref:FAD-dependent monooxygenase n=1 Tax=Streptomyces boetiae TaxID=3075541 RepID=UPI00374E0C01
MRRFGSWHHPVPALLAGTSPGAVLRHDIRALATPLPVFHQGRVALLGDAAHAMTPNLGQGGCQAIEDAVVLAHLTAPGADVPAALAAYSGMRVPRATAIARRSWQLGRLSAWTSRPAVALRTGLFSLAGLLGSASRAGRPRTCRERRAEGRRGLDGRHMGVRQR